MDELTTAAGILAAAAALAALAALVGVLGLRRRLRALREAQAVVLGDGDARDVLEHQHDIDRRLTELAREVEGAVESLRGRDSELAERLEGAVAHCAVVRYDAMGEMTGRQSSSVALLDSHRSGVVISSILHRDHARLYAKQIVAGRSEFELSPEEKEALAAALGPRRRG